MRTNTQRLLDQGVAVEAFLCREARVHSNDLMSGTCSLGSEYIEKRAPTGIENGLREMMVFHHVEDTQILNMVIGLGIRFGNFEMMVTALPVNLQVRLRDVPGGLAPAFTALLATAQLTLLPPERLLRGAIETRVSNAMALGVGQEGFQANINANVGVFTRPGQMFILRFSFTDDEGIPVSISTMDKMDGLRSPLDGPVQLDLEKLPQFGRDMQMFVIGIHPHITGDSTLPELNGMPLARLFEAGEPYMSKTQFFGSKKPLERLGEAIGQHLHGGSGHLFPTTTFEGSSEIVLRGKGALCCILCLDCLQHLIIDDARLSQALHEQLGLFPIHEKAILKGSHSPNLADEEESVN